MNSSLQKNIYSKNITLMKSLKLALGLTISTLMLPAQSDALQLTFEMRINPIGNSPGVLISPDFKSAQAQPGNVLSIDIYAVVNGANASNTDDGFLLTHGSFLSAGPATGDFSTSPSNNVAPFNGGVAQSGVLANLDNDPDLELGSLLTIGTPSPLPWFIATTSGAPVMGTVGAGGPTAFIIGHTTFTLAAGATGQAQLTYAPRNKTDGLAAQKTIHKFTLDGVAFSLLGNSPEIVSSPFLVVVPEPSAFGMVLLGAMGLIGYRRVSGRKV